MEDSSSVLRLEALEFVLQIQKEEKLRGSEEGISAEFFEKEGESSSAPSPVFPPV